MNSDPHTDKWLLFSSIYFGVLGFVSLLLTDLIFLPSVSGQSTKLYFSKEPTLIVSVSLLPAIFSYFAASKWLRKDFGLFRGWLSVACFSWLSLVMNPIIWLLVIVTFTLYGFVALGVFLLGGIVLQVIWQVSGNQLRLTNRSK